MDEDMILLDNVMPVEIALKRELEYRKKVEALRKHQQSDPLNGLLPIKEPLANVAGTKRKAPSLPHPSCEPQEFQKQPAGLVCITCEVAFSTLHYLKKHCASQAHKDKLLRMKNLGKTIGNYLSCKLCNAPGSSPLVLEQHLKGIKHAAALKTLEIAESRERRAGHSNS